MVRCAKTPASGDASFEKSSQGDFYVLSSKASSFLINGAQHTGSPKYLRSNSLRPRAELFESIERRDNPGVSIPKRLCEVVLRCMRQCEMNHAADGSDLIPEANGHAGTENRHHGNAVGGGEHATWMQVHRWAFFGSHENQPGRHLVRAILLAI